MTDSVPEWITIVLAVGSILISVGFIVAQIKQLSLAINELSKSIRSLQKEQQHTRERVIAIETQLKNENRPRVNT